MNAELIQQVDFWLHLVGINGVILTSSVTMNYALRLFTFRVRIIPGRQGWKTVQFSSAKPKGYKKKTEHLRDQL